jgi:hypothetical protein
MADYDIQKSQHLLKRLKEEMSFLSSLLSQAHIAASNLESAWTAVRVTYENWKRDIEKP